MLFMYIDILLIKKDEDGITDIVDIKKRSIWYETMLLLLFSTWRYYWEKKWSHVRDGWEKSYQGGESWDIDVAYGVLLGVYVLMS